MFVSECVLKTFLFFGVLSTQYIRSFGDDALYKLMINYITLRCYSQFLFSLQEDA